MSLTKLFKRQLTIARVYGIPVRIDYAVLRRRAERLAYRKQSAKP